MPFAHWRLNGWHSHDGRLIAMFIFQGTFLLLVPASCQRSDQSISFRCRQISSRGSLSMHVVLLYATTRSWPTLPISSCLLMRSWRLLFLEVTISVLKVAVLFLDVLILFSELIKHVQASIFQRAHSSM
ncbi:hypothetical protein EJ05DRAFT_109798 [Pseudovirgaria hyperparasitica]|uniref:Uncharacterized protein n=1 Tax=Pseudovirgaria hyperparasitica TaxID=470096 RepID=A0A6A6W100_9PEZI|nr:uncharacterized protein EJ05DRAFT_109798 [Pseudovirgaria hyperparasitica]KAF2755654.1 hypothetical protein EJ05DRAFT_109798 [Pseudovirgaria hyperparasitica]